jgi:Protein of unknown function DUF262
MGIWNSSPHPISDIKDWQQAGRLEVRPDFQRREVWSLAARIMLIDTILRGVPMPKMFVWNEIVDGSTHRRVIDGQQRIMAILDFLCDKFALEQPYEGPYTGKLFSELPKPTQGKFLQYRIDFNEALDFSEEDVREVYSRVNKYSLPLNKQELRHADYPGQFLQLSLELALTDFLDESRVFTAASKRRMGDVEFVSELLAGMLEGPQDKKGDLDHFYARYAKWPEAEVDQTRQEFQRVLRDIQEIFSEASLPLRNSRFRQKSDFYTLFLAIHDFHKNGYGLSGKDLVPLRRDFQILHSYIAPESDVELLREYAIKCVSQANSQSSRAWRKRLLSTILSGTYRARKPSTSQLSTITELLVELHEIEPETLFDNCIWCKKDLRETTEGSRELDWPIDATVFQLSNAGWKGAACQTACEK